MATQQAASALAQRQRHVNRLFEGALSRPNQPIANMLADTIVMGQPAIGIRHTVALIEQRLPDFPLGKLAMIGHPLDHAAIAITRFEIHAGIDPGRIALEHGLDPAGAIEEVLPLDRGNHHQIGNGPRHAFGIIAAGGKAGTRPLREGRWHLGEKPGKSGYQQLQTGQPQHTGKGPEFGNGERIVALIAFQKMDSRSQPKLHMRGVQQLVREEIGARQPGPTILHHRGQAVVEGARQIFRYLQNGTLHLEVVIQQPLRRRGILRLGHAGFGNGLIQPQLQRGQGLPHRQGSRPGGQPMQEMTNGSITRGETNGIIIDRLAHASSRLPEGILLKW